MTLHVVQLGPVPPPDGGISHNIMAIRRELHNRGHRCSLVATSRSSQHVHGDDLYFPRSAIGLITQVLRLKPDVVHLHLGGDITARVMSLALAATLLAPRTVLTLHSGGYPHTKEALDASPHSMRGRIFRRFSRVVAVNEAIADVFKRYGISEDRLSVVPPYALDAPDPAVAIPPSLSSFIDRHSPVLLSVGGLEPEYDPVFQVEAFEDVMEKQPEAGLLMIGDGSMRAEVDTAIEACGCGDRILLSGSVDHAITLHLIKRSDVVLRTTLFDGDAISLHEAVFLGTPVVATDTAERPKGTRVVRSGDKDALVQAILSSIGTRSSPSATADMSNIQKVVELYEGLLSPQPVQTSAQVVSN